MSFYDYYHDIIMLLKYVEIFTGKYPGKFRKFSNFGNFPKKKMKFSGQFFCLTTLVRSEKFRLFSVFRCQKFVVKESREIIPSGNLQP